MTKVLIIDDEEKLRTLLARIIGLEGYEVIQAGGCKSGLKALSQNEVNIVLCDVKLPDGNGVELVKTIKEKYPLIEIIVMTAYGNIPDGVQAIKNGAFDYLTKGDDNNKIIPLVKRAIEKTELSVRNTRFEKPALNNHTFENILGKSKVIHDAIDLAQKVSVSDTNVLLTGETGTGKEVFASSIHKAGKRASKNFVAVNCSAFSRELLDSEMFGHKAGAFTGAVKETKGIFEEADQGTVFLDEIGEMPLDLQAKLLRVLETGTYIKVGDSKTSQTDVRIIAATNRNLKQEVEKGNFRQDLYYRISVFQINLPPLRERTEDIEIFIKYFVYLYASKMKKTINGISNSYVNVLKKYCWPGNVRELKNIIERSVLLTSGDEIGTESLPLELIHGTANTTSASGMTNALDLATIEKEHILKVLNHAHGNKTETAKLLNIALTTLYRKLEDYKIG